MRKLLAIATTAGLMAVGLTAAPASADPFGPDDAFPLTCGNEKYDVVVAPGSGNWTPAFDTGSNRMFVPVSFGVSTFVIRDESDKVIDEGSEPGEAKQGARVGVQSRIMTCTYEDSFTFDDPDLGTLTGTVSGKVYVFVSH